MEGGEPPVPGEGVRPASQYVQVSLADPGDLNGTHVQWTQNNTTFICYMCCTDYRYGKHKIRHSPVNFSGLRFEASN